MKERPFRVRDRESKISVLEVTEFAGSLTKLALQKLYEKPRFRVKAVQSWLKGDDFVNFEEEDGRLTRVYRLSDGQRSVLTIQTTYPSGVIDGITLILDARWESTKKASLPRVKYSKIEGGKRFLYSNTTTAVENTKDFLERL